MMATAVVKARDHVASLISKGASFIQPFLPEGVTVERVIAAAQIAVQENEKIADCDPWSIVKSVATIQQWGLEIGVTAYLVPFYDARKKVQVCTAIADYKGLCELMIGSGCVRGITLENVYEGEEFEVERGLDERLRHVPNYAARRKGQIVGAYAIFRLPYNVKTFEYMPIDEIEEIRAKSRQWSPDKVGAIPAWYSKKTVLRRGAKLIPKNARLAKVMRAMGDDARAELGEEVASVGFEPVQEAADEEAGPVAPFEPQL